MSKSIIVGITKSGNRGFWSGSLWITNVDNAKVYASKDSGLDDLIEMRTNENRGWDTNAFKQYHISPLATYQR